MLQQFRAASKTWVAKAVLGVLVVAFALWGVADIFTGNTDTTVAIVGDTTISANDYDRELRNALRQQTAQGSVELTMEQARTFGIDQLVLKQMIERAAVDHEVNRLGLTASNDTVGSEIRNTKGFQGASGSFDAQQFQYVLQQINLSEAQYVESVRSNVARTQMIDALVGGLAIPNGMMRLVAAYMNEQRTVDYIVIRPEDAGNVGEPSTADLDTYHKAHADQFSTPEYRTFDYIDISPQDVSKDIAISDDDLKQAYEIRKSTFEKPEEREIEQISFPTQAEAQAGADKIKSGTDFGILARSRGLKDEDVKLGTFSKDKFDTKLADTAFSLKPGEISAPTQGQFGWVLLRVTKITPGTSKSFDDLKDQLRTDLVAEKARGRIADLANALEDAIASGATFPDAAMRIGVTAGHADTVDAQGKTQAGVQMTFPSAGILSTAFATDEGTESDLSPETPEHHVFIVKVASIKSPALRPLDEVRAEVKKGWTSEQREKKLSDSIAGYAAKAERDKSLSGLAAEVKRPVETTAMPLARSAASDIFSKDLMTKIFAAGPSGVVSGQSAKDGNYIVARVKDVTHPAPADNVVAQLGPQMAQQLSTDLVETFAAAARDEAKPEIHQAVVARITGATE